MQETETTTNNYFRSLKQALDGDLYSDILHRLLYATDASAYREIPAAVALPRSKDDIKKLIRFAREHKTTLIPRTAGTSLAGQVVGNGIVVDVSKHMNDVLEINAKEKWIRVQPGVVLDEMNQSLKPYGLFFAPETSTGNRCMIGGMVGNNSCGLHSLIYGSTREHTLSVHCILSDGSEAVFHEISKETFQKKCNIDKLEGEIYRNIRDILSSKENQENIRREYPHYQVPRRNTGYAIDVMLETEPFAKNGKPFNFAKFIAGSEGTLAFITEIKLNLIPLPPPVKAVIPVHCPSVEAALHANLVALKYKPGAIELMDKTILDLTRDNLEQKKNRFFLEGDPGAILIVEFARSSIREIETLVEKMEAEMRSKELGFHFPVILDPEIKKVWNLRKAGLGVLSNMPGDAKPVSVIEDTSVKPELLPEYIGKVDQLLKDHGLSTVYHAHIATGEIHVRPILNLKDPKDVELFHTIAEKSARLVKEYKGSLSGEHGDGRLRGEFIPVVIGEKNYQLLRQIKKTWDPEKVFNANKITETPRMNTSLRYEPGREEKEIDTIFDFSREQGILRAAEKCNGSGDCRKSHLMGGTMCPSYMATRDESATTRARANILREFLTSSRKKNPFDHQEIYNVMDLCLMCKGCKSECPSSVDITKYKAEFLQHYYDANGTPLRTRLIANISRLNKLGMIWPAVFNFLVGNKFLSGIMKSLLGFASRRSIPKLYKTTFTRWARHKLPELNPSTPVKKVYLFADEFTEYNDVEIGIKAIKLLTGLGYEVVIPKHKESGRTYLSKGLVRKAGQLAKQNLSLLKDLINEKTPLIGIEPSGILSFRDEYPELLDREHAPDAKKLAENCFMFDEFFMKEVEAGNIQSSHFSNEARMIKLHGHCHQKALASTEETKKMLSLPENFTVEEIPSGCCGMAGSFGYEKEHYDVSMKVGELVLFPEIRKCKEQILIAAPGTSCRHQIKDGTNKKAYHPVEIMHDALLKRGN
ncbi:MAG: FAD-binding protein [Bacteroidales bacterium]|nr:FAD-binding protein [Bacteroidales bacterium]MCF8386964.1 FAD-binding protein [Bacteroidales bacterium]MCF8398574.1 FAD-binding protein [Bacteroidales bacterium]